MPDDQRIRRCIDTEKTRRSKVAVIGVGAAEGLVGDLARCGVANFDLSDMDVVTSTNLARAGFDHDDIGSPKVKVVAKLIRRINPDAQVFYQVADVTTLSQEELDARFSDVDLIVAATDSFLAQAFVNRIALRYSIPGIWLGLYAGGGAGEIVFWHEDIDACYRCLCEKRYKAQEDAQATGRSLDPPSDGATIGDIRILDGIGLSICLGLLTRGTDNRFGRLIEQLGDRNFLQVRLDPSWAFAGRDIFREVLGVPEDNDALFCWNVIARRDNPSPVACPDCEELRGHRWVQHEGEVIRQRPDQNAGSKPSVVDWPGTSTPATEVHDG